MPLARPTPEPAPAGALLCHAADVPEGAARGFLPAPGAPRRVIVVRREGQLHAWLDNCPHYDGGAPMAWRRDAYLDGTGAYLACHAHGALFEVETGECVAGPCLGQGLWPVPITVSEAGEVRLSAALHWDGVSP